MAEGYIGLYRCLLDKPIWQRSSPEQKTILVTLLLMANHEENEWEWMGQKFRVFPGQFVTSIESIVKACGKGVSIQNVRSALEKFQKLQFLTDGSTKCGRLVTILKWHTYQVELLKGNKDTNVEVTKRSQRGNKEVTPNKNDKNDKNDKKEIYADLVPQFSDDEDLQKTMFDFIEMRVNKKKTPTEKALKLIFKKLQHLDKKIQIETLEKSIIGEWVDVFPPKDNQLKNKPQANFKTNHEKSMDNIKEWLDEQGVNNE